MYFFLLIVHLTACISLILIVLLQSGKGGGLSGLMGGGGGAEQIFGASTGMAFVKKVTVAMAITFVLTSLLLTIVVSRKGLSTVTRQYQPTAPISAQAPAPQPNTAPAAPKEQQVPAQSGN